MDDVEKEGVARLIGSGRWAALGTCRRGAPLASMVAYAAEPDFSAFYMLLSRLSLHTRHILQNPRASLAISEPETAQVANPQTLARVSVQGEAAELAPGSPEYGAARTLYEERLPASVPLFGFGDFLLFRFVPREARYVAGFARAYTLTAQDLVEAAGARNPRLAR